MAKSDKKSVDEFVRFQLYKVGDSKCRRFVVKHAQIGAPSNREVNGYDIGEGLSQSEEAIAELVSQIWSDVSSDAEGLGGMQRYQICAYFGENDSPTASRAFRVQAEATVFEEIDETGGIGSEPPTKQGIIGMFMRHTEGLTRTVVGAAAQAQQSLQRENVRLATENEKLREKHFETFELMQELLDMKVKRDLEMHEAQMKSELKQAAFGKLLQLAPTVINKLSGQNLLPDGNGGGQTDALVTALMGTLTPEQLEKMQKVLTPEQMAVVGDLYVAAQAAEEVKPKNGEVKTEN